ncbi:hypothetical protein [Luteibacter yeojuensis]|uniref:Uncharacterized protein n=1 Tax=Luteibacter yeojuensis TaxID=345309 RepID=A0A7X5TQ07_9GAMM|nr:hypothetical protein [Luteibacter yeojuensis]NID15017.1 hypothetical protein [Luteibacter yeojuensis]
MNDESSKYRAVQGTIVSGRANSFAGFILEVAADISYAVGDRLWISKTVPASQPAEQPRGLRNYILKALGGYLERYWPDSPVNYDDMADYITQALPAAQPKPEQAVDDGVVVGYIREQDVAHLKGGNRNGWRWSYIASAPNESHTLPVYTTPHPADATPAEVTDVPTPTSIDRRHPNQAYVTVGFDSEDACSSFIKAISTHGLRLAALASPSSGAVVPEALLADLRKFHEETEACDEFDLTSEATAALLSANLIEGTHFVLTAKGEALLAAAPEVKS